MINVSGFGLSCRLTASNTFSAGFTFQAFSDDADPLSSPNFVVADSGNGLNGDLVVWNRANAPDIQFNVIATSYDDVNLSTLLEANRCGKRKRGARDVISIVVTYPSGIIATYSTGVIIDGDLVPSVLSSGKIKTRGYRFRFESRSVTGETGQDF